MTTPLKIHTIIFDLGHVIVEINHRKTSEAFEQISKLPLHQVQKFFEHEDFLQFELGKISEPVFFEKVSALLHTDKKESKAIMQAWNSMIIGIPPESIRLLQSLKNHYQLFALSNTNRTHLKTIQQQLFTAYTIKDLTELFHKVYYSFELGLSKPDPKIFEYVLTENQIAAENILFIDDNFENICASKQLGFQTIHLHRQKDLRDELRKVGVF